MIRTLATVVVVVSVMLTAVPSTAVAQTSTSDGPEIIQYGAEGNPSYVVELEEGADPSKIEDWSNKSSRQLVNLDNSTGIAVVAAPRVQIDDEMGLLARVLERGVFVDPLGEESYVKDVSPNYRLSLTDPKSNTELMNVSDYEPPESAESGILSDDPMPHDGMAFDEDANRTTMAESRSYVGADNVSETGSGVDVAVIDTGANTAEGRVFGEDGSTSSTLRVLNASKNVISNETVESAGYDAIEDGSDSRHGTWVASAIAGGTLVSLLSFLLVAVNTAGSRIALSYIAGFLLAVGPFDHVIVTVLHVFFGMLEGAAVGYDTLAVVAVVATAGNLVGGIGLVSTTHLAQARG